MNVTVRHMQVSLDQNYNRYTIASYRPGEIVVTIPLNTTENVVPLHGDQPARRHESIQTSMIILPERLIRDWPPTSAAGLTLDDLTPLLDENIEVMLLGTGTSLVWPDQMLRAQIAQAGIGLEVMDTGAACRTYNILIADQRQVAAALILDR